MKTFEIRLPLKLTKNPKYSPPDVLREELNNLEYAMDDFFEWYLPVENKYHIVLDGQSYTEYVLEIPRLWWDIPYHLQQVVSGETTAVIGIIRAGTNFFIRVDPLPQKLQLVSVILEKNNNPFSTNRQTVRKWQAAKVDQKSYIQEWQKFVKWIVDILVRDGMIKKDDPSLTEYLQDCLIFTEES